MNLRYRALSLALILVSAPQLSAAPICSASAQDSGAAVSSADDLRPTDEHWDTLMKILVRLDYIHYRSVELDDAFSSHLLDRYLEDLDPGHWFFLASDIAEFDAVRHELDDQIQNGNLETPFAIFRKFQERRLHQYRFLQQCLQDGLDAFDFDRPEELISQRDDVPLPADQAALDALWHRRLKNDVLNLRLADQDADKIVETLQLRYQDQLRRVEQVTKDDVFRVFSNALAAMYGPHSEYFPPLDAENFDIRMSLSFEGIGALLGSSGEYVRIERIIPGGPAEAGDELKTGDRIVAVGQDVEGEVVDVVGWRVDECVKLIRGEKGTTVRLVILAANQNDTSMTEVISIVRDRVKLEEQEAQGHLLEIEDEGQLHKVGVIELPAFYMDFDAERRGDPDFKSTTRDVARLIAEFKEKEVDGLVVDLRSNSGGSLTEAHNLVGLFLGKIPVVQVRGSQGDVDILRAESSQLWDGPMAVLVNRLSASASEIFAAAIQDTGRGLVIGTKTFGKGTVQNLMPIDQGTLKVTLAKFYRLSGGSTQHMGVVPDIEFPSLFDVEEVGESTLDGALPWDRVQPVAHVNDEHLHEIVPALQLRSRARTAENPEFVYLMKRVLLSKEARKRTGVSLNEAVRRLERERDEGVRLALENQRRVSLGLEPVATWDELRDAEDPEVEVHPFVREAAQVLVDSIRFRT